MPDPEEENFKIAFRHWTGTVAVAVLAGFVIFGLLRGQEVLNKFLKSDSIDANLEKGEILEPVLTSISSTPRPKVSLSPTLQILSPTPTPTPSPTTALMPSPTPELTLTPVSTSKATPTASPENTPTPILTPTPQAAVQCESWQVDINTASKEELMKIKHIGSSRAEQIISLRQEARFKSVDDLTRVSGIGPTRINDIKTERIACVQ